MTPFTVQPAAEVAAAGSTVFTVRFAPGGSGARSALLTISNDDSDEGTFIISVSGTGQTQYDAWSGGPAANLDSNGDGVPNGLAFLLGASGPNVNALDKLPTATSSGGNLVLLFSMRNAASRGGATLSVQHSSDLGIGDAWDSAQAPETTSTVNDVDFVITPGTPLNTVEVTIPATHTATGKLFGRVEANVP